VLSIIFVMHSLPQPKNFELRFRIIMHNCVAISVNFESAAVLLKEMWNVLPYLRFFVKKERKSNHNERDMVHFPVHICQCLSNCFVMYLNIVKTQTVSICSIIVKVVFFVLKGLYGLSLDLK
jgi:hypothetical protein